MSFFRSKSLFFIAILFATLSTPARADQAVNRAFSCLDAPVANNDAFIRCLAPLEARAGVLWGDARALDALVREANNRNVAIGEQILSQLSEKKQSRMKKRLNDNGFKFFGQCLQYQMEVEKAAQDLVLARCGMDSELFILHSYFDNYRREWAQTK